MIDDSIPKKIKNKFLPKYVRLRENIAIKTTLAL